MRDAATPCINVPLDAIADILSLSILRLHRRGLLTAAPGASKFPADSLACGLDECESSCPCGHNAVNSPRDTGGDAWQ